MKTRCILFAALTVLGLGVSGAMAQGMLVPVAGCDAYGSTPSSFSPAPAAYSPTITGGTVYGPTATYYAPPTYAAATYAAPSWTVAGYPAPVVTYRPVVTQYVQPAVAYRPVVTQYVQPAVAYRPVVTYQQPYAVYSPVVVAGYSAPVYSAPAAVPAGPRVIVRPKVYVEGQPIRNLIRAITP